jgi:PAS domain S-box-containing protein
MRPWYTADRLVGGIVIFSEDITERRQTRAELDELRNILAAAESVAGIGSWKWDLATQKVTWSDEMYHLFGIDRQSFDGDVTKVINDRIHPDDIEAVNRSNLSTLEDHNPMPLEYRIVLPNGIERVVWAEGRLIHDKDSGAPIALVGYVQDITERKRIEAEQARLEEQLRQAQKMESIGRLAGGVAHDFNNQLTVIQLYSDWLHSSMAKDDPLLPKVVQIRRAAEHAASLTRQLLAFSRKQVLRPVTLDLNDLVANLQKMLGRLIGEDIILSTNLEPGLWPVQADRGQIEQVIMNLVVNARDAMPTGGVLTIETSNVILDELIKASHLDAPLGPCVMLSVTDTGLGMDAATQKQIFEPFFTTKAQGKGTGLGLATVHGIVNQSGGTIYVYSEPGQGATFKIYLPARGDVVASLTDSIAVKMAPQGHETILLVEDEAALRDLVRETLQEMGYSVLEAGDGRTALELVEQQTTPIDLLLTDVVMPQMSGRELAQVLTARWPAMKVLFMSGYMDDKAMRQELLTAQVNFLAKPFTRSTLASKVRDVLDKA